MKKNEVRLYWEFKDIKQSLYDGILGESSLGNYNLSPELSVQRLGPSSWVNSQLSKGKAAILKILHHSKTSLAVPCKWALYFLALYFTAAHNPRTWFVILLVFEVSQR